MKELKTAYKHAHALATGMLTEKQKRKAIHNWAAAMKTVLKGGK